jgi:hypothetical protein
VSGIAFLHTANLILIRYHSLCPVNSSVPISAAGIIPVAPSDVANIPNIAFSIPDFEGEAILRIFSNDTQAQIACYSAVVTNGASFSQPAAVGSTLGAFAMIAVIASFATAIYGESVTTMRLHYAHSMSVGVVFAVFQHIFFSGALSLNWPSVLVAWWSNFAWAGGMIRTDGMQSSIDSIVGNAVGNTTRVGAAQAGSMQSASFGGGFRPSSIYGRSLLPVVDHVMNSAIGRGIASTIYERDSSMLLKSDIAQHTIEKRLANRLLSRDVLADSSTGYTWYGHAVYAGLPLPGNFSGFAGTLSIEEIRLSNAFMTGMLWFLILLLAIVGAVVAFKWAVEGLVRIKLVKVNRLRFFREHWMGYTALAALRTCGIAFFMIMLLTMFQFTYPTSTGVNALAAIFFIIFFVGMLGAAIYAVQYKKLIAGNVGVNGRTYERTMLFGKIPWPRGRKVAPSPINELDASPMEEDKTLKSTEVNVFPENTAPIGIHDDEEYIKKFGWLAARFRRTRWWFFSFWLGYEFLRAAFYGGSSGAPMTQVIALLVIEVIAWAFLIWARPFEGQRLNFIVVWCLSFSKVVTLGLSLAFLVQLNVGRIITTAIGIVIIVVQGLLTIITLIAILVGAISSYMSVSRNQEDFRPRKWAARREKYFDRLDKAVNDLPAEPKPKKVKVAKVKPVPLPEPIPGFEMRSARRLTKIEDDDADFTKEMQAGIHDTYADSDNYQPRSPTIGAPMGRNVSGSSRPASIMSTRSHVSLPYGARPHRASWTFQDVPAFADRQYGPRDNASLDIARTSTQDEPVQPAPPSPTRAKTPSRKNFRHSMGSAPAVRPRESLEQVSSQPFADIPAPSMRARADSTSRPASRTSWMAQDADEQERDFRAPSKRASWGAQSHRRSISHLQPAQETEEIPPMPSLPTQRHNSD